MAQVSKNRARKSLRLKNYDYGQAGYYFITICTQDRRCLLGDVIEDKLRCNSAGRMIIAAWEEISEKYEGVGIDQFVVMPNHLHGIIVLHSGYATSMSDGHALSLPKVVHGFKSWTTKLYSDGVRKSIWKPYDRRLWQRNYFEHVIRNEAKLTSMRQYILDNPKNWAIDSENPINISSSLC